MGDLSISTKEGTPHSKGAASGRIKVMLYGRRTALFSLHRIWMIRAMHLFPIPAKGNADIRINP